MDGEVLVAEANTNSFGWALLLHSRLTAILIKAMAVEWKFISVGDEDARCGIQGSCRDEGRRFL